MQNEEMLKDLVKYEAKIEQLESTIKNQQANPGACKTTDELEKLQAEIREQLAKGKSIADPAAATSCLPFSNSSDIQTIRLPGAETFQVTCDSKFAGEGWTVIQRRVDDSVDFNRNWEEYKNGFGGLRGNFWLGLEKLHLMTKFQPHELYIQLEDFKNEKRYARYTNFSVGNEAQSYELLSVGEYNGNAGDALSYLKNTKFTTKDRDNDKGNGNCGGFMHVISACDCDVLQAKIREQETTITTLEAKLAKDKSDADAATSCLPFGNSSDMQTIRLPGAEPFQVPCDSKFNGSGWAVIQRRMDGSVNFNRTWDEYKNGFGDLRGEFWLGLERLHLMTKFRPHELYIQLENFKNETRYVRYSNFSVGNEAQSYELLSVGEYDGDAGNTLDTGDDYFTSKNMKFSTPERDNDKTHLNCAALFASGWWFSSCSFW
ncbi:maker618 [Drosophila busckii]|uniref:Maker618 n=1 Tax=Drosophila busckii TaxID=30019 RepID=A0A0M4ESN0_DROBS|nr:maker618 [Drosophila busckii]